MMISTLRRRLATASAATAIAAAMAVMAPPLPAMAGAVADKAAEAEALLAEGKNAQAVAAFDAAAEALWAALPLTFRVATFVSSADAYGKYELVAPSFRAGDTVTVYLEPIGYGFVAAGALQRVAFTPSLEIRTPGGLILGQSDAMPKIVWAGRPQSREVHTAVSVALPDLRPGDYELRLTLADDAGDKEATATLPFAIVE